MHTAPERWGSRRVPMSPPLSRRFMEQNYEVGSRWVQIMINQSSCEYNHLGNIDLIVAGVIR